MVDIRASLMLKLHTGIDGHFKLRKRHGANPDRVTSYYYRCVHCGDRPDGPDKAEAHFRREHSMYLARIPPGYPLGSVVCRLLPDGTWARGRLEGILDCQATCRYLLDVAWDKATLGGHRVGLTVATFNDFRLAVLPPDQLGQVEDALAEAKVALKQIPCVSLVGAMLRGPLVDMQVALRSLSYTGEAVRR